MTSGRPIGEAELERLQHQSFSYFLHETNPDNGLVIDKTAADWPASIAATGRDSRVISRASSQLLAHATVRHPISVALYSTHIRRMRRSRAIESNHDPPP